MKRTIFNYLLLLCFISITTLSFADNYDERCFIAQIKAGTEQVEIDALLDQFNLTIEDGPTTEYINQFVLLCIDPELGFPEIENNNGEIDINAVIGQVIAIDDELDEIIGAIGLNFEINPLPSSNSAPSTIYHHPLEECGQEAFSINTAPGIIQRKLGILDSGIKTDDETGLAAFFDPFNLGWNIIEDTFDPADDNGHGTHMASSIALGTPPNFSSVLTLKAYKTHDITGTAEIWHLLQGIDKAMFDGAEIINMSNSYGAGHDHRFSNAPLKIAIEEALDIAGILFVVAAGNKGYNNDDPNGLASYPASFETDNILAVTAVNCNYMMPQWANKGTTSVDIAAPGVNIWGLDHNLQYIQLSGTSSACALTSRVAAMLATQQTIFDYSEIKCAIINGANQSAGTPTETLSGGYLDATLAQLIFNGTTPSPCSISTPSNSAPGRSNSNAMNASVQNGSVLSILSDKEQIAQLRVFNLLGQTLYTKEIVIQEGQNNFDLEMPTSLSLATYICHLQYGNQSETIKFIK